ncbi:UDP-N-acetylmuramoyl-L-alanyl-D-glutamate--2,6-diaminopimelate ligase [Paenibacillus antarcticus]|uniref:UDP-N-acetylmuramyl-tripeptide synthetase n=1 Tax=Paenibacillus antarcticus TaxID=253703 RepID=A0A162K5P2_9BACL|nr:UDP-N-acetylmuramoyl-L-alanyl-D-glutamate--2,6-diaminopimelate ligase [Paenibacillus antarcticus]OAB41108.1 UDP-N-acetylmuramoyl-L-alanyl-D-glutamate--2,6-diaminopimelate ligase [Paenibacillus antarcticus]
MKLKELVEQLTVVSVQGELDVDITGITINSREVKQGNLFVCIAGIPGLQEDRHLYIDHAIEAGAVALIVERDIVAQVPTIKVPNARFALAMLSTHFFGYPSHDLKLIGVTGTNGKTTTSHMIEAILAHANYQTGLMGNIGTKIGNKIVKSNINTQEPHKLQANLAKMKNCSTDYCVMEVTSQGLDMGRVIGCDFRTAVFTNLTDDHLDYHGTMDKYLMAKGTLFSRMGNSYSYEHSKHKFAILNADDPASELFHGLTTAEVITYGINNPADVMAEDIQLTVSGTTFRLVTFVGTITIECSMVGAFNVYNALASIATALAEQIPLQLIQQALSEFKNTSGRMEIMEGSQDFIVIVDYAHTPDAVNNALSMLCELTNQRVITVFSCEDDHNEGTTFSRIRDIAAKHSDVVILSAEHLSNEAMNSMIQEIANGQGIYTSSNNITFELMPNGHQAATRAIELATTGDIVFIAGVDHKTEVQQILKEYQTRNRDEVGDIVRTEDIPIRA